MTKRASVPPRPSQELLGRGPPVLEKSGDCLSCHRSAVRNWVRRQDPKNLRTAKYCWPTVPSADTVVLRFSLVSTNQP
jgi:hypothetical protein